jgi:S1-C subfamily serine protease
MNQKSRKFLLISAIFTLVLVQLACASITGEVDTPVVPTNAAATPATRTGIANLSVPFEAVVQIWAMYYDEVGELQTGWTGSGTIISPEGLILSNAHVVLPDRYFPVDELVIAMTSTQDEEPQPTYFAEVLQADAALDLAVVRVATDMDGNSVSNLNLPYVPLGDSGTLSLGDAITILGYPGIGGDTVTLTRGEVSGFTSQPQYGQRAFIKTSATIAGGNSGGLAVDAQGNLIGVPTQLGYGGDDQFVDCRVLADTNRDGFVDDSDSCVPTGGFINALRPVDLAIPLIEAAQRGEVSVVGAEEPVEVEVGEESAAFSDDFSDEGSGWDIFDTGSEAAGYAGGEYVLSDINDSTVPHALAYRNFSNLEISVDVRVLQSAGNNEVGVFCRYVDTDNYYGFTISEDGSYLIYKIEGSEFIELSSGQSNAAILGDGTNTINVLCDGSTLGLGLNDQFLTEANDSSFVSGDIALNLTAWEGNDFSAAFDNITVTSSGSEQPVASDSVFSDDFADNSAGWNTFTDQEIGRRLEDGMYYLEIQIEDTWIWSTPGSQNYSDLVLNVDVSISEGTGDGDIGLICRYVDADNFYAFEVTEDGYYAIWKMSNGEQVMLADWQYSDQLSLQSDFTLNAACQGNQLTLGFNGELLTEATDSDFSGGNVGVIIGTLANPNLVVAFDNFEVLVP